MRPALMQYGPPEVFYVDNGEDFKKVGKEICPWLGIEAQFCKPYHGQSKPIERQWRTMKEQFEILFSTFTGGKPELRPDQTTVEMARHRKLLKMRMLEHSNHPPASYFIGLAATWIDQYNNRAHTGQGMDGRTPNEVFAAYPNPGQRAPLQPQDLIMTLSERKKRLVQECAIRMEGRRYVGVDNAAAAKLHDLAEEEIVIAYDSNDPEGAAVLTMTGHFICWVKREQLLQHSREAKPEVSAIIAQREHLQKRTQNQIDEIHRLASQTGVSNGLEVLERKANLRPIAVGEHISQRRVRIQPIVRGSDTAIAEPSPEDGARLIMDMED
jgi:hypothetical protein